MAEYWLQLDASRVLYVDRGVNVILCDRLPSDVTLVVKMTDEQIAAFIKDANSRQVSEEATRSEALAGPQDLRRAVR
jgi:hypothetical protein